jgi:hypothetical protein
MKTVQTSCDPIYDVSAVTVRKIRLSGLWMACDIETVLTENDEFVITIRKPARAKRGGVAGFADALRASAEKRKP